MDRRNVAAALLAALAVLALATAAASLDVLGNEGGDLGTGSGDGPGVGTAGSGGFSFAEPSTTEPFDLGPFASTLLFIAFLLLAAYGLLAYWRTVGLAGLASVAVGTLLVALFMLFTFRGTTDGGLPGNATENATIFAGGGGGSLLAGESTTTPADPSFALAAVVLLGIVGAAAAFVSFGSDDVAPAPADGEESADADVAAVGRAAGEAADRIATGTDVENEVYRAWETMTAHLDVADPETSTPAEFAAAAVDAGMDPDDVAALTRLFDETRYGGYEVTDDRAERALTALRDVEAAYADEEEPR